MNGFWERPTAATDVSLSVINQLEFGGRFDASVDDIERKAGQAQKLGFPTASE